MITAKEIMSDVIAKLNKAGFEGGFYKYKKDECSCCYGNDLFFQVNENLAGNWSASFNESDRFYYKITYRIDDKAKATKFRLSANKLAKKAFGKLAETAKTNYSAIIINVK